MDKIIVRVRADKKSGQKIVTIPKDAEHIQKGDYVKIERVE